MKRLLLITFTFFSFPWYSFGQSNIDEIVVNNYATFFAKAYQQYPEIPKGVLEAVSFCNTHFTHLQHTSPEPEGCAGIPNAYGVMGLTLDGQNYFSNNLITVAQLSGYSVDDIIGNPEKSILAYAKAYSLIKQSLHISGSNIAKQVPVLVALSELPQETKGQNFALHTQLFGYLQFLNTSVYQQQYGFPNYPIDFQTIFGANNYEVLSSADITVSEEIISNKSGQQFQLKSLQSTDYGPALWTPAGSCNYSSRNGTAVSAVTIHTVQGSYAGCISWFQNCAANVSAHYVIRSSDGQITQMVLESKKAWHVGNENPYTIGLEHEGYIAQASWYTNAMYTSSAALVRDICNSGYGISGLRTYYGPGCSGGAGQCGIGGCTKIKGHQMYPGQSHTDPGPNWNWKKYYLLINNNPTITTVTGATGTSYDNGGPSGNYTNDQRLLKLIQPAGATSVTLNFTAFNLEANYDYLLIYNGTTTSAPLIGQFTGNTSPGTITSNGGSLLLEFRSDCATTAPGWAANWTSNATPPTPIDNVAPTTLIANTNSWETTNFTANFTDADNTGGSGLEKSFYQVIDFDGTEWRANANNGFFADNFDYVVHPDWTSAAGTWGINGGTLYQSDENSGNTNIYASLTQNLSNRYLYNFYAKIDGAGTNKRAGLHIFCDNASLSNRGNSYLVWIKPDASVIEILEGVNNVTGTPVASAACTTVAGQWYDYKIIYDRISGKISVYRNNQFIISWIDASPLATGNGISFRTGNATLSVNELKVYRSRPVASAAITVGAGNTNDIRYQNSSPTTPSGRIKSICTDVAGNISAITSEDVNVDWTPPSVADSINDGTAADISTTNSLTDLSANWTASVDSNSALSRYWYAIGTTSGGTDILNYTDNWFAQSATVDSLSLVSGQTYYFSVKAENGAGLLSAPFTSNGQTVVIASIDEQIAIQGMSVFPNPFSTSTTIIYELTANSDVLITLTDLLGKEHILYDNPNQASGKHKLSFNTADLQLAKGIYFIKLQTNDDRKFVKIIAK
ncbi:MAG: N-acetylmuramoyl-L-alanine amidase [Bacteroidota bacterium]